MDGRRLSRSPIILLGLGVILFLLAVYHHGRELADLDHLLGPLVALLLDGLPALGIAYAGYWLAGTDLTLGYRRTVAIWGLGGGGIFVAVIGATFLVRAIEGRVVSEPQFPLLIAAEIGVLSGLIAGYYNVQARVETERARTVGEALSFVNDLLRHDLRNDLSVIRGHADLIGLDEMAGDEEEDADVIADKAEEALSRIETSRAVTDTLIGDPELQAVNLAAITTDLVERTDETYDITVETDITDEAFVAANDGLRSAVDNLLENAVEHNDADEPRLTVGVSTEVEDGTVRLTVRDNGPGIPNGQKERLLNQTGMEADSGGLAIVRTLVDGYGGDLRIEDNEPRGSVFVVELPHADCA